MCKVTRMTLEKVTWQSCRLILHTLLYSEYSTSVVNNQISVVIHEALYVYYHTCVYCSLLSQESDDISYRALLLVNLSSDKEVHDN